MSCEIKAIALIWGLRVWFVTIALWVLSMVVPVVIKVALWSCLRDYVLPAIGRWFYEQYVLWGTLVRYCWRYCSFHYRLRLRQYAFMESCSKRVSKVMDILDMDDIGENEMELLSQKKHIRCAVLLSRRARIGLRYPGYSKANEKVACDWILRHCPDDMTIGMKHKVLPLAVKLTFVKSQHEVRADCHFKWLETLVDKA